MTWHDLIIEIVDIQRTGDCNFGHKVGDVFKTSEDQRKICGAAYHALYPYIVAIQSGGSLPWEDDPDSVTICCPDYKNPVVFKISRKPSESNE